MLSTINKAIKIRIYPTALQRELLSMTFGCCRLIWNQMLAERKNIYQTFKSEPEILRNYIYKTESEYKDEFQFMKEEDSKALQSVTQHLIETFRNFFNGLKRAKKLGYPRFKSRKTKQTYTTYNINNNIKINFEKRRIKLPKIKTWINIRMGGGL